MITRTPVDSPVSPGRTAQPFARFGVAAVLLTIVALAGPAAHAQTLLYSQASAYPTLNSGWTSDIDTSGNGYFTFDNFTLGQSSTIDQVSWQGFYYDATTPANNPVPPTSTVNWQVAFASDSGNQPSNFLLDQVVTVQQTFVGTALFNGSTVNVYNQTANLGAVFSAAANTEYWFGAVATQSSVNPIFVTAGSANTNGISYQYTFSGFSAPSPVQRAGDRVFSLSGSVSAPEPTVVALTAPALGVIGLIRRRRSPR